MFRILNKLQQGNKHSSKIYGEVAQLARARGSYPRCRGFKSPPRYGSKDGKSVDYSTFLPLFMLQNVWIQLDTSCFHPAYS